MTGTKAGWTEDQADGFRFYVAGLSIAEFHHGDCIGSDEESHRCIRSVFGLSVHIILHPPANPTLRAFLDHDSQYVWSEKPYLARNADIVAATSMLIATPGEHDERLRSGTWATVRRARSARKPVMFVFPDGTMKWEHPR